MGWIKEILNNVSTAIGISGNTTGAEKQKAADQSDEKRPLMAGSIFGSNTTDNILDKNSYEVFYAIYNNTPELFGLYSRIRSDIMADGYEIKASTTDKGDKVKIHLTDIDFDEKLESTINDLLITGDGFMVISTIPEGAILEAVKQLIKEAHLPETLNALRIAEAAGDTYAKYNLYPIKASTIKGIFDDSGYPKLWKQEVAGEYRSYAPENIIHIKLNPVSNDPFGNTPLYSLRNVVIAALMFMRDRNLKFFQQGGTPNHLFTTKAKYGSDTYKRIANILREFNLPKNAHKNILLSAEDELGVHKLVEHKDMDFPVLWDKLVETIFVAWGMPPTVAGLLGSSKVGESSFAHESYYKNIDTLQRKIEQKLNKQYFKQFGEDVTIEFNRTYKQDEVREVDIQLKKTMVMQTQLSLGLISREAAARELGISEEDFPPDGGGDVADLQQQLDRLQQLSSPNGKAGIEPQNAAKLLSPQKTTEPPTNKATRKNESATNKASTSNPHPPIQEQKGALGGLLFPDANEKGSPYEKGVFKTLENKYVKDLKSFYKSIEKNVLLVVSANNREYGKPKLREKLEDKSAQLARDIESMTKFSKSEILKVTNPNVTIQYETSREFTEKRISPALVAAGKALKVPMSLQSKNRFEALKVSNFNAVKGLNDETRKNLTFQLNEAILNREGVPEIKKRIKDVFKVTDSRAEVIARTETNRTYNESTLSTYSDSGVVDRVQWLTTIDDRTAPADMQANGSVVELGKAFPYVGVSQPPAHPNCRCTVLPFFDSPKKIGRDGKAKF